MGRRRGKHSPHPSAPDQALGGPIARRFGWTVLSNLLDCLPQKRQKRRPHVSTTLLLQCRTCWFLWTSPIAYRRGRIIISFGAFGGERYATSGAEFLARVSVDASKREFLWRVASFLRRLSPISNLPTLLFSRSPLSYRLSSSRTTACRQVVGDDGSNIVVHPIPRVRRNTESGIGEVLDNNTQRWEQRQGRWL